MDRSVVTIGRRVAIYAISLALAIPQRDIESSTADEIELLVNLPAVQRKIRETISGIPFGNSYRSPSLMVDGKNWLRTVPAPLQNVTFKIQKDKAV